MKLKQEVTAIEEVVAAAEKADAAATGATNAANAAASVANAASEAASPITEDRIWKGVLHVVGHSNDMVVPCVAMRYPTPTRPQVSHAQGWPAQIDCDMSKLKQCASVFKYINEPNSQWYVRFAPINDTDKEISDPKLVELVKVMVQREIAYEVDFGEGTVNEGTLYLWGMPMPPHGLSLLGAVRPKPQQ